MNPAQARESAREILKIVPLVMRTVAAELRSAGELPAPAHFGLLTMLSTQPRSLSELAALQGVSLPTMSNSISAMVHRGWVRRVARGADRPDRRIVMVEVTTTGRAALERVGRCAEAHIAERLTLVDGATRRRLRAGLAVLREIFANGRGARPARRRGSVRARTDARGQSYMNGRSS
jgi:DNA-binding MarR family transcriptional regulator